MLLLVRFPAASPPLPSCPCPLRLLSLPFPLTPPLLPSTRSRGRLTLSSCFQAKGNVEQSATRFVDAAVDAFFDQTLVAAGRQLLGSAEGSFGLVLSSSIDAERDLVVGALTGQSTTAHAQHAACLSAGPCTAHWSWAVCEGERVAVGGMRSCSLAP